MAKIIKSGRKQAGWSKKVKCTGKGNGGGGCKAELLVSEYDIYMTIDDTVEFDGNNRLQTFCCPQCGVETNLKVPILEKGKRPSNKERKKMGKKNLKRKN